ncbi:MAG: cell surface protein, partial [Clostridia bacterium]|nr:cell surface protein [Clostridia bacterium]
MNGRALEEGEFSFVLKDGDGRVLETVKNRASGEIAFEPIGYTEADLPSSPFTYTISEVKGNAEHVVYDESVVTVKVTLAD